ncbi:hypothetical protein BC937DRAFT_90092, partial [Endogone sp. FLAS-F59071]
MLVEPWKELFPLDDVLFETEFIDILPQEEIDPVLQVFINAAALSRLAYEEDPVAVFNNERKTSGTTFLFIKVIKPQTTIENTSIRRQMLIGFAKSTAEETPIVYVAFCGLNNLNDVISSIYVPDAPPNIYIRNNRVTDIPQDIVRHFLTAYPCVLTGHSFGGTIASQLALEFMINYIGTSGNVWEPAANTTHVKLSVVTFGAPFHNRIQSSRDENLKSIRKLFHNVLRNDDPIVPILNLLPSLKKKSQEVFENAVIVLKTVLNNLMLGEPIGESTMELLTVLQPKFSALIPKMAKLSIPPPVAFGFLHVIEQGEVVQPSTDTGFYDSLRARWGGPETMIQELSTDSLESHMMIKYVRAFKHVAGSTTMVDINSYNAVETMCNSVLFPQAMGKANGFIRGKMLEVVVSFSSSIPEDLFTSVKARTDNRRAPTYPVTNVKHQRHHAKISNDTRQVQSSFTLTMKLQNQYIAESLRCIEMQTVLGDIVTAQIELHYRGFVADLNEPTSLVLKKELIRMFLSLQSNLTQQPTPAPVSDDYPANLKRSATILEQLIANSRLDLFLSVANDALGEIKEQFGFTGSDVELLESNTSIYNALEDLMQKVNIQELLGSWPFLRQTWQVQHPDWNVGLQANPANPNELYRPFPTLDKMPRNRQIQRDLSVGVRKLAKQYAEELEAKDRSQLDGYERKREDIGAELYRNLVIPNIIVMEALIMSSLQAEDILNSAVDYNTLASKWRRVAGGTATMTAVCFSVEAAAVLIGEATALDLILGTVAFGAVGALSGAVVGGVAIGGFAAWKSYIRPKLLQWGHRTLEFNAKKTRNIGNYRLCSFPFARSNNSFHEETYKSKLNLLFEMANVTNPSDTAAAETEVWSWLKNTPKMTFLLSPSDLKSLPKLSPVRHIVERANSLFSTRQSVEAFLHWVEMVALIGEIRSRHDRSFTIGVVGLARLGKSTLIGRLFSGLPIHGGGRDKDRTTVPRYWRAKADLHVIDFPGANESSDNIRACVTQTIPLLNAIIIVCQAKTVDSNEQKKFFFGEVKNFLRQHSDAGVCFFFF